MLLTVHTQYLLAAQVQRHKSQCDVGVRLRRCEHMVSIIAVTVAGCRTY